MASFSIPPKPQTKHTDGKIQQIGPGCIVKESLWLAVLGFTPAAESGTGLRGEKQGDLSCLDRNWKY